MMTLKLDRTFIVDFWRTGMHKVEIGIKKQQELMSKSRQFTKDMDIIGTVTEKDKTTRYIAIRKREWEQPLEKKRLILKIFTEGMGWRGTVEQLVAKSLAQSVAARKPLIVFSVNLSGTNSLITLERVTKPFSFNQKVYAFSLIEEDEAYPFYVEENRLTLGKDWTLKNMKKEKIADINGSQFNIGGKYKVKMPSKGVPKDLDDLIILFCGISKYLDEAEKAVKSWMKKAKRSKEMFVKIDSDEAMLYRNPRKMTY